MMRLAHRVGRRGCYLLFLALLDLVIAYSMTPFAVVSQLPVYRYLGRYLPLQAWAGVWVAVGIVCAVQAFARRDHLGFAVAAALKLAWAGMFFAAWAVADIPRGWVGGVVWLGFGAITAIIASWPESRSLMLAAAVAAAASEREGDE